MKHLIFPVLLGLGLVGCSQSANKEPLDSTTNTTSTKQQAEVASERMPLVQPPSRNVIYNGELDLAVDDFAQASAGIEALLQQHRAYLSTAHETRADGLHRQEMKIKVHPTEFSALVSALSKLGRIETKDVSSADVTADVLDAAATLSAMQRSDAKYQQLLTNVTNLAEIRRLEEQARQARLDVAAAQANLQQLGVRSAWATLTLRYYQVLPDAAPISPMADFTPRFWESFNRGWSLLLGLVIVLTNVWPLLLLGGAGAFAFRRWRLRHPAQA